MAQEQVTHRENEAATSHDERGRRASSPREIPRRGWLDVLRRTKDRVAEDNVGLVAAGVAFYIFLAIPPGLAALISVYGLFADPAAVQEHLASLTAVPGQVRDVLEDQMQRLAERPKATLGWTLAVSLALAVWSASKGMRALMRALNIAYDEAENRGFVRQSLLGLAFTAGAVLLGIVAVVAIAGVPALIGHLELGQLGKWLAVGASWALLLAGFLFSLAVAYRFGPNRRDARSPWITPGALATTVMWVGVSALFSLYVSKFGGYGEAYGSLAAVVVLLLWLWISAMAVLLGAELNAELEHQTAHDTTRKDPQPRVSRDAAVADSGGRAT